jgi:hypothetical protein
MLNAMHLQDLHKGFFGRHFHVYILPFSCGAGTKGPAG